MKRTVATRLFILLLILGTVLSLPGILLAAVGAPVSGCPHCRGIEAGISAGCCCVPGTPGHCGNSGQGPSTCRCGSSSGPAFTSQVTSGAPIWPASLAVPILVTASSKVFPPNIFHPPEL
jgi:hypothetical protein